MDITELRMQLIDEENHFTLATAASLKACGRMAALREALVRGGVRASDPICTEIDQQVATGALALWEARQARDAAADALRQAVDAEARGPTPFERQLALVQVYDPRLYARYEREVEAVEQAHVNDVDRARYVLSNTRAAVLRYEVPVEVAS